MRLSVKSMELRVDTGLFPSQTKPVQTRFPKAVTFNGQVYTHLPQKFMADRKFQSSSMKLDDVADAMSGEEDGHH